MRIVVVALALSLAIIQPLAAQTRNIVYIFDASGSMWAEMGGSTRIEIAKRHLLERLPYWREQNVNVGLVAYGHNRRGDCGDIEVLVDLKPLDEAEMRAAIEGITPRGMTPIAASIELVTEKLRVSEEAAHVILISDGEETCHPDPCTAVAELKALGIDFTMDVIGFDITAAERAQLECLAAAVDGTYYSANDPDALYEALRQAEEIEPVQKIAQNVQIILDRSESMLAPFAGQNKLSVVLRQLERKLGTPSAAHENLALRTFGGTCGDAGNTELAVPFATDNGTAILHAMGGIELRGQPTLADGLMAAIRDFDDPRRFEGVARRAVVFAGSRGACDPMQARDVHELFRQARIDADVHLIALDPPPDHIEDLRRMVGATGGSFHAVRDEEELARVVDRIFDLEPVLSGVIAITNMLNEVVGHLNDGIRRVERQDFAGARQEIHDGKRLLFETRPQFADLGERTERDTFRDLYELAETNRELQEKGFSITEDLADARSDDDTEKWNMLINEWNASIRTYNDNIRAIDNILRRIN